MANSSPLRSASSPNIAIDAAIERIWPLAVDLTAHLIASVPGENNASRLSRIQTLASQMDGIADDAFAEARRSGQ